MQKTAKRDEKEWLDFPKDKNAKYMRINNKIQVSNQRINSPATRHKDNGVQTSALIYRVFTDYTLCKQQSTRGLGEHCTWSKAGAWGDR